MIPDHTKKTSNLTLENVQEFDGLRGVAIINVLILHTIPHHFAKFNAEIIGQMAVPLFFAVSGFCITYGIFKRSAAGYGTTALNFVSRRFRRIYPPYIIAVFIFCVKCLLSPTSSHITSTQILPALLFNVTLTQVFMGSVPPINPAFWSLCVETQFYCCVALWLVFLGLGWQKTARIFSLLVLIISLCFILFQNIGPGIPRRIWFMAFPHYAPLFFLGAAVAWLRVQLRQKLKNIKNLHATVLLLILLSAIISVPWGWLIACLIIVAGFAAEGGICHKLGFFLRWRPLLFLGERSYSIYLAHGLGVAFLSEHGAAMLNQHAVLAVGILIFTWGYCIGIGAIYYQLVERRFLHVHKS